ncbi:MAG TPA: hypothetical protein VJT75_04085 [Thermoleophilaceae bacterium]|nr:hypothetical protein [Thermoleophilaceae bacterium]
MRATRWQHFRRRLGGRLATYGSVFALAVGLAVAVANHDLLGGMTAALAVLLALMLVVWREASSQAEAEFFTALAPTLGLRYMVTGSLPPITPLMAAGGKRSYEHYLEGPLFGALGGPRCGLAHYTFSTVDDEGREGQRCPFTVCGAELPEALPLFHGVYLRPRGGVAHDWLDRAPRPHEVELESTDFNARYELRAARDQDPLVLHELFSPSFVVWLAEHPLRPGFECKGGDLVAYLPGHELDGDHITLLHDFARAIARRVEKVVESRAAAAIPAG